jgi:RecB family exonuclease
MRESPTTLAAVCQAHLLDTKWLLAPSHRVGHQWIEALVRGGQAVANLRPTTPLRLAVDLIGDELAADGLALIGRSIGPLLIDAAWERLPANGYLGRLEPSAELSSAVFESVLSLRMAGVDAGGVEEARVESAAKAKDIAVLLDTYRDSLNEHRLVDEADVFRRAMARLKSDPEAFDGQTWVLVPASLHAAGLEREFLDSLPAGCRVAIRHPADRQQPASGSGIQRLARIGQRLEEVPPAEDESVQFFRAVGEINEVREVLRRCLADETPLDDVELLHTDAETYISLIYATARRFFDETDRPEGIPVTFAEGLPASISRPGRALSLWLLWIDEGFPQRLLIEMISEGLLDCGESTNFSYLARLLRPLAIGAGADHYLPKLDEQIEALESASLHENGDGEQHEGSRERRLLALTSLRGLCAQLLELSQQIARKTGPETLDAAETFLTDVARTVNEQDAYAVRALIERVQDQKLWLERLGLATDPAKWLAALPTQTRVLGSGPRPGHLHVSHVGSGGHSGRRRTFVVGLDDRRFPGAALQDPVLLDRERNNLSPELPTSGGSLRRKMDDLAATLSRLAGTVTLSWPCRDLTDDRETFPSSVALSAFRLFSGRHDADLEALNAAVGTPVSFAPTTAAKSLDESERWLWWLSDEKLQGTNQLPSVEARFGHLSRGSAAARSRFAEFGPYSGFVPRAGQDLNPFAETAPALSASALEAAGHCPLKFFFRNGLKLLPPEDLEFDPDRWLDPRQFGLLLHEVFREFHAGLSADHRLPDFERDHRRLADILGEAVQQWRGDVPPLNENAYRIQYWQLIRTAKIFLQDEAEFCRSSRPRYFEVALGLKPVAGGSPLDDVEPVTMRLPGGNSIRAKGQIDRVDEIGSHKYSIWDYKAGSSYGYSVADPFRQGRRVQNILYLHLIETALRSKIDPAAVVERFGYFFPGVRAHGLRVDWDARTLSSGLAILDRLCAGIAEGAFVATNNKDDCRFCDYASVCRDVDSVTSHSHQLLKRDDLPTLRHFRELRRG